MNNLIFIGRRFVAYETSSVPLPSLYKIMRIYSCMTHGVTLKSLCFRTSPRDNNIDERLELRMIFVYHS